jgi:CO/xanthine dehydrogenase FAD-binding subunit
VAGNAVQRASKAAATQVIEAAAEQSNRPASEMTIVNGLVGPRAGPESEFRPIGAVVRANIYKRGGQPVVGVGDWDNPSDFPDHTRYGNESGSYNFAAQAAEVEVDRDTGEVKVLEIAAAVDCGTVIHPAAAEGQVQGAVTQGLGYAMVEYFDWHNGAPTDPNFIDYPIPTPSMLPKIHALFADSYEPSGPFGAKGLGEIGLDAVPAARANAVADAFGVRIDTLPITAEKIHRALHPALYADEAPQEPAPPRGGVWNRLSAGRPAGARPFKPDLVQAASVEDAVRLLAEGDSALVCGGISHAVRRERTGFPQARRLIAINRIPELNVLSIDAGGTFKAGAAVNHQIIYEHPRVAEAWRAVWESVESVGHARIRRMMTVGGTVGPLIGGFDFPVALIALNGRATIANQGGRCTLTLHELFEKRMGRDEMLVSVEVDTPARRSGSCFLKFLPRGVIETPTVNAAAAVTLDASGRCAAARVVVGSVSFKPIVLDPSACVGLAPDDALFRQCVLPVRDLAAPLSNVRGSVMYKRNMAVEFAFRALREAAHRVLL